MVMAAKVSNTETAIIADRARGLVINSMQTVKCVVVGDSEAKKNSLLIAYTSKSSEYVPTVFENYAVTVMIKGEPFTLGLYDTAGNDHYERLRPLSYPQTDVFLVCFSIVHPPSFENAKIKWVPEISYHCPGTPFLLVGTQSHLREDNNIIQELAKKKQRPVHPEEGRKLAYELGAVKYLECSDVTQEGVKTVFDEATLAGLKPFFEATKPVKSEKHCVSL